MSFRDENKRLLAENQRLIRTHDLLREDLTTVQLRAQRVPELEAELRTLREKLRRVESESQANLAEQEQAQLDAQKLKRCLTNENTALRRRLEAELQKNRELGQRLQGACNALHVEQVNREHQRRAFENDLMNLSKALERANASRIPCTQGPPPQYQFFPPYPTQVVQRAPQIRQ